MLSQEPIFEYNYQPPKSQTDRSPQVDATGGNGLSRASERLATHCIGCAVGFSSPKQTGQVIEVVDNFVYFAVGVSCVASHLFTNIDTPESTSSSPGVPQNRLCDFRKYL